VTADSRSPAAPLAIRITRPYATEDEFLEHELDTLTRASITLVGAQPRAEGVVLRFELVLTSGLVLVRGEGRVTGFKPNMHQGLGGLSLRFTRLDTRSKVLIDKAAALREKRRPSLQPPSLAPPPPRDVSPVLSIAPSLPPPLVEGFRTPTPLPHPGSALTGDPPTVEPVAPRAPDAQRDALLDRLRTRARSLPASAIEEILDRRHTRR
jgi:hypothetical protein